MGMGFENMDPKRVFDMAKDLVGNRPARLMFAATIYLGFFGFAAWMISVIRKYVISPLYEFVSRLMGFDVTLDNLESLITTLFLALLAFALLATGAQYFVFRHLRRRRVPQWVIDDLAEWRSKGVSLVNDRPTNDEELEQWIARWEAWKDDVAKFIGAHFTKAEELSFRRLGLVVEAKFGTMVYNNKHAHKLMLLAKQLGILETMIDRQLERY
jgi:hypothetical protein